MKRAITVSPEGRARAVKNLGWLLRNWKAVERFEIRPPPKGTEFSHGDALMIAHLHDGERYEILWASREVLKDWIHRPVFRGIDVDWFGEKRQASPRHKTRKPGETTAEYVARTRDPNDPETQKAQRRLSVFASIWNDKKYVRLHTFKEAAAKALRYTEAYHPTDVTKARERYHRALQRIQKYEDEQLKKARALSPRRAHSPMQAKKREHAFRILDLTFGNPAAQQRGFRNEEAAAFSAATLLAARIGVAFSTAQKLVLEWYQQGRAHSPRGFGRPRYFYITVGRLGPSAVIVDYNGASINVTNDDRTETVASIRRAVHKHWPGLPEKTR
jgi:hypothetical protein